MTQLLMMSFSLVIQLVYNSLKLEELVGLSFTLIWPGRNTGRVMRKAELCLEWKPFLLDIEKIIWFFKLFSFLNNILFKDIGRTKASTETTKYIDNTTTNYN